MTDWRQETRSLSFRGNFLDAPLQTLQGALGPQAVAVIVLGVARDFAAISHLLPLGGGVGESNAVAARRRFAQTAARDCRNCGWL